MRSVFADTFHFLALFKSDDPYHGRAVELHRVRWQKIVTTECVLLETGDACCAPNDHDDFLALHGSLRADSPVEADPGAMGARRGAVPQPRRQELAANRLHLLCCYAGPQIRRGPHG